MQLFLCSKVEQAKVHLCAFAAPLLQMLKALVQRPQKGGCGLWTQNQAPLRRPENGYKSAAIQHRASAEGCQWTLPGRKVQHNPSNKSIAEPKPRWTN